MLLVSTLVPSRLVLTAEYMLACKDWPGKIPSPNCTRLQHPFLWGVDTATGKAESDPASAAVASLSMLHYGPIGVPGSVDGTLLAYVHINQTMGAFVHLGPKGVAALDYNWPWRDWFPERLMWSQPSSGPLALLEWTNFRSCGAGPGAPPWCNITRELFSTAITGPAATPTLLWRYSNNSEPTPPPPADQDLGYFMALDAEAQKLYSQPSPAAAISVFDLTAKSFDAPLPGAPAGELICLHHDAARAGSLGALVAHGSGLSLVSIDVASGASTTRLSMDVPTGLQPVLEPGAAPMCSWSPSSGSLALLLGRVDPSSPRGIQNTELFVLEVDTRSARAAPPTKIALDDPAPAPGQTWRLVAPFLKHTE